eukprot:c18251_g1_i1 orf=435-1220(-)
MSWQPGASIFYKLQMFRALQTARASEISLLLKGCRSIHHKSIGHTYRDGGFNVYGTLANIRGSQFMIWNVQQPIQSFTSYSALLCSERAQQESARKDVASQEDPFDSLTDKIPERPVTFAEGASYTVAICVGFAIAAAAAYAVFKELVFEPKEYKIFGKALERVQQDSQVRVRLGTPITGYGQESRNRAARQRIPNRVWTDEDGVERVEVQFYIRGPHGAGRVHSEMFRDKVDKNWKFTYLLVDVVSPSPIRLMLESYVPS